MNINDNLISALTWAQNYINEYKKSGAFDPYAALSGEADRKQKIFIQCVSFITDLENITENHRDILKKYL